jgi:hypothetical protein
LVCEYELVLQVKIFCLVIGVMEEQRVVYFQDLLLMGQDKRFWKTSLPVTIHGVSPMIRLPNDKVQIGWGKTL